MAFKVQLPGSLHSWLTKEHFECCFGDLVIDLSNFIKPGTISTSLLKHYILYFSQKAKSWSLLKYSKRSHRKENSEHWNP